MFKKDEPQPWHKKGQRKGISQRHSGSFKKGHSGQWPRPADADTRLVMCPKCNQLKLLTAFLSRNNHKRKLCRLCFSSFMSMIHKSRINKIRSDPKLILAALNRLDELQAMEARTIPGGPGNVERWRYHIAKWARQKSIVRSTLGLQPKRGVRGHFEYQARHGIIPADSVEERVNSYYERHPNERPADDNNSQS